MFKISINLDGEILTAFTERTDIDDWRKDLKWSLAQRCFVQNTASVSLFNFKSLEPPTSGIALIDDLGAMNKYPVTITLA